MGQLRATIPNEQHWAEQVKCQAACPVHTDARGYVQAIAKGDYEQAYLIARAPNPLASICGRMCGAPCETACRRGEIDSPIQIRALKRFVAERFGVEAGPDRRQAIADWLHERLSGSPPAPADVTWRPLLDVNTRGTFRKASRQRIAIVGSGPAGLAAAHDLALMGFAPVIFEMEPVPAGLLYLGVPEYRLPRDIVRAEVRVIQDLGVEIRCNVAVGRDVSLPDLRAEFDAVVLAVGAKKSRRVNVPGADGPHVLGGVEFLRDIALGNPVDIGNRVVVIGGGNVAFDVGRSVIRHTQMNVATAAARLPEVAVVHICSLERREDMPADHLEIIEGSEEGIHLHNCLGLKAINRDVDGRVTGVTLVRCTRVFDEHHRFSPHFDESQQMRIDCDTVLLAIGQQFDVSFIDPTRDGIELMPDGRPVSDPHTLATTADNVYVAGDLAHGPKLLIHAVASGKQAARSIYRKVVGEEIAPRTLDLHIPLPNYAREYDYEARKRVQLSIPPAPERIRGQAVQVELPLLEAQARYEASRCLNCGVNPIFDSAKCILCGGCADICPSACLKIVDVRRLEPSAEISRLKDDLLGREEGSAILMDDAMCIRCGLCASRCPAHAITMEQYCVDEVRA
jgi:NADPH-dependent glutamate synthase beta subunit-like oxidoreductase